MRFPSLPSDREVPHASRVRRRATDDASDRWNDPHERNTKPKQTALKHPQYDNERYTRQSSVRDERRIDALSRQRDRRLATGVPRPNAADFHAFV